jgi:hypothetical protein
MSLLKNSELKDKDFLSYKKRELIGLNTGKQLQISAL